jgi:diguanylate cyclase (GGDEF)-like protein/PAS domain S-box-containing protein
VSDKETMRVLIVDDDTLLRGLCALALRPAGYDLREAECGEDAVISFTAARTDLVILDVQMDGIDGYETCRRIRRLPGGSNVPVIMLTGLDDADSIERAYEAGATDFIAKPFQWPLLAQRVRYALRAAGTAEISRQVASSLARAQEMAHLGSWSMGTDGTVECSEQLLRILGLPVDARRLRQDELLALIVDSDRKRIHSARHTLAWKGEGYEEVYAVRRADGATRTVYEQALMLSDERGDPLRMEGITQDITDRVDAERRIQQLASHDVLTGLANRDHFQKLLAAGLERAREDRVRSAVLHLDIDRFTGVNDALGSAAGDAVLKTVAARLCSTIGTGPDGTTPRGDVVGRVGGDAFTIFMASAADVNDVAEMAQRLLRAIAAPIVIGDREILLTARMGIAMQPRDSTESHALLRYAEQALHVAKHDANGSILFYDASIGTDASSQLAVETDLRRALSAGEEMLMYLQPKVDIRNGTVCGAEALIRWQHPVHGVISPADFIPLAEKTGLIGQITEWMLEQACRQIASWKRAGLLSVPISVNISASWFTHRSLVEHIDSLLRRYQVGPGMLVLEVTESLLVRDVEKCTERMRELRQRGIGISLDDFGTGYSSLSYLKVMPLDELKLDRSFVTDIGNSGRDQALAASVVQLARHLDLAVVAEGVETEMQASVLAQMGCHIHQGYLYGRPALAAGFYSYLLDAESSASARSA